MAAIWKFPLLHSPQVLMNMPAGAKILCVQMQDPGEAIWSQSAPFLWVEVEPEAPLEMRKIAMYGTGNELPREPGQYIGTVQDSGFVWHFYDRTGLAD